MDNAGQFFARLGVQMNSRSGTPSGDGHPAALASILEQLQGVKPSGGGWTARCPAHEDTNPSLSVRVADDGKILLHCFAGCATESVMLALGREMSALAGDWKRGPEPADVWKKGRKSPGWESGATACKHLASKGIGDLDAIYDYADHDSVVRFAVAKFMGPNGKTFRPLHLADGRWHFGDPKRLLPLFRLPPTLRAQTLLLVLKQASRGDSASPSP